MLSWLTKRIRREPAVLGFGKIRALPEFVRSGKEKDAVADLETWVSKAVQWSATHRAGPWREAFDGAPVLRFVLQPRSDAAVFVGAIGPGQDSLGRRFPVCLAAIVPTRELRAVSHVTPLAFAPFFHDCVSALRHAAAADSHQAFDRIVAELRPPQIAEVTPAVERYDAWAQRQSAKELLDDLFAEGSASIRDTLHTILEATEPFQGKESPPTALSIRLPSRGREEAVCACLHLVRAACGWQDTVPGYFATDRDMLVQLGGLTPPNVLADCWAPDDRSQFVCHPGGDTSGFVSAYPEELEVMLAEYETSMAAVIERFGTR